MSKKSLPTPELLRKLLRHEPGTGRMFWECRQIDMFEDGARGGALASMRTWNTKNAGKRAFTTKLYSGYLVGAIFGDSFRAHRVIWALHYGEWPNKQIDHINQDRTDNRIVNLRDVTNRENSMNRTIQKNNSSGVTGVCWYNRDSKWAAYIMVSGEKIHLGYYDTIKSATNARFKANMKYGFSPNHGA